MNPRVFREYDIRGVAQSDLPDEFIKHLGRALAGHFLDKGCRKITLGRDCRATSPRIAERLREQLVSAGLKVLDIGVVHSPGLYFSVFHQEADGGIMITASHNPGPDNGFKIVRGRTTIHGAEIQELRRRVEDSMENAATAAGHEAGSLKKIDILTPYVDHIAQNIQLGTRRPRVVLDAGNGVGGISCVPLLQKLGFEVEQLFCEPDGTFPNHHPDPTVAENLAALIERVKETGAEVGIALDGDGDRIGVVDAKGRIVWGDQLMILFAREILAKRPGATFVSEVKCSQALYDEIERAGGRAIMWKVGHSLIKKKMKEEDAALAGEMSGHMFFADRYYGFDDAVYAAARLMELLSHSDRTLTELVDTLPQVHNTPEIRIPCPDDLKFQLVERACALFKERYPVNDIDGARITFPGGWGLVRASNTGPVLVMRCEAESPERLNEIRSEMESRLDVLKKELESA